MPDIRTLIFDLGNVIVPFDFGRAYERMEALSGLERGEIRDRLIAGNFVENYESGQIPSDQFVTEANRRLGTGLTRSQFQDIWVSIFERRTLIPDEAMESLAGRYRVLLLSNTNQLHFEWIDANYPILRHMHHRVLSYQAGATKPHARIYQEVLRHAHAQPGECFYADDIAAYVAGGREHGIDAVQFTDWEALRADLASRGIVV